MTGFPIITVLTLTPLAGAAIIAGLEPERKSLPRGLGLGCCLTSLALALRLWFSFDAHSGELQFVERYSWIPSLNVEYFVGVDGLGLLMVLLTALVVPFALIASWRVAANTKAFVSLMLLLEAGLFGAFTALNFVHWFLFWELSLCRRFFSSDSGAGRSAPPPPPNSSSTRWSAAWRCCWDSWRFIWPPAPSISFSSRRRDAPVNSRHSFP